MTESSSEPDLDIFRDNIAATLGQWITKSKI